MFTRIMQIPPFWPPGQMAHVPPMPVTALPLEAPKTKNANTCKSQKRKQAQRELDEREMQKEQDLDYVFVRNNDSEDFELV